jgi:hypothetical protein
MGREVVCSFAFKRLSSNFVGSRPPEGGTTNSLCVCSSISRLTPTARQEETQTLHQDGLGAELQTAACPINSSGSFAFGRGVIECVRESVGLQGRAANGWAVGTATRFGVCADRFRLAPFRFGPTQYGCADAVSLAVPRIGMAELRSANWFGQTQPGFGTAREDARPTAVWDLREGHSPFRIGRPVGRRDNDLGNCSVAV